MVRRYVARRPYRSPIGRWLDRLIELVVGKDPSYGGRTKVGRSKQRKKIIVRPRLRVAGAKRATRLVRYSNEPLDNFYSHPYKRAGVGTSKEALARAKPRRRRRRRS